MLLMNEDKRVAAVLSFFFLSSQLFSFMEAMASTRLCSRMLQSGAASTAYLQTKVSDAKSLIRNTMNLTKIYSGISQSLRLECGCQSEPDYFKEGSWRIQGKRNAALHNFT